MSGESKELCWAIIGDPGDYLILGFVIALGLGCNALVRLWLLPWIRGQARASLAGDAGGRACKVFLLFGIVTAQALLIGPLLALALNRFAQRLSEPLSSDGGFSSALLQPDGLLGDLDGGLFGGNLLPVAFLLQTYVYLLIGMRCDCHGSVRPGKIAWAENWVLVCFLFCVFLVFPWVLPYLLSGMCAASWVFLLSFSWSETRKQVGEMFISR